jgi:mycofactocin system glycosyltransferase
MGTLPEGFGLVLDRSLRRFRGGTILAGGHPGRVLTLSTAGATALDDLLTGGAAHADAAGLAGLLVETGMAHPRPPETSDRERGHSVAVVVPVRDRPDDLDRCLASIGSDHPVVVVDDASHDPAAVAAVAKAHGAKLVVRTQNGGPGRARNDGLGAVTAELVAFVDSDCTATPGWLDGLTWMFDDPELGGAAPRVRPRVPPAPSRRPAVDGFNWSHSALDLGPKEGEVGPRAAIRFVPSAALIVRRSALLDVGGFDPAMRVGEDVDLVWRLVAAGWRVRYAPSVVVAHAEPRRWVDLMARRFRYGTSAGSLATRHPGCTAHIDLRPWPTAAAIAVLAGRPRWATLAVAGSVLLMVRRVGPLGVPPRQAVRWSVEGAGWTVVGIGRAATMLAAPGLVLLATRGRRGFRAAVAMALVPPTIEWVRRRPELDLPRWVAASMVDDFAYGVGVWIGCIRSRALEPLLPGLPFRPVRRRTDDAARSRRHDQGGVTAGVNDANRHQPERPGPRPAAEPELAVGR